MDPRNRKPAKPSAAGGKEITFSSPITVIRGIGPEKAKLFAKKNLKTVGDLLRFYPREYQDRGQIRPLSACGDGEEHAVLVRCTERPETGRTYSGVPFVRVRARDDSASLTVTFFGRTYLGSVIRQGRTYRLYGKFTVGFCGAESVNPDVEPADGNQPLPAILPIYPLTAGMTQHMVRSAVSSCLYLCARIRETLPEDVRASYGLLSKKETVRQLHRPESEDLRKQADRTAAFEDLLVFQLALRRLRSGREQVSAPVFRPCSASFTENLPFALTGAQKRAVGEILSDLSSGRPMARLVQGDVGSGKTVVAAAALECCARNGMQAVLLAPTELLAEQHGATISRWLEPLGIRVSVLTSSVRASEKKNLKRKLAAGEIDVLIGTHAVLQEDVVFRALGMIVTDEQHRFGVRQRAALLERSEQAGEGDASASRAHMLVMSATPIPRSLSLILYGDLDVSVLDELPAGRQPIETMILYPEDRDRIYRAIRRQIGYGGQAYIICPLVEDQENPEEETADRGKPDFAAAETYYEDLRSRVFPDLQVGLVHGRMSGAEKAEAMRSFASGETKILVSTTVIEVGVDVPNANVMLIENAERFGLSQLHQLRGRIGRGSRKSFCVLLNGSGKDNPRLNVMRETSDGFRIAEEDLKQRGPGDFFGEAQSGAMALPAGCFANMALVAETKAVLESILPKIEEPEFVSLRDAAARMTALAGDGKTVN
ncbi:MAG: ATP-dependent DNA helicase RecG [Clostridia bacterium]|nr:ATP-dependent DNA helicase RecG [Clostridia bacterium]